MERSSEQPTPTPAPLALPPPVAFGFLTATPRNIMVDRSTLAPGSATPGSVPANLGLVAGPVNHHRRNPESSCRHDPGHECGRPRRKCRSTRRNTSGLTVTSFAPVAITARSTLSASTPSGPFNGGSVFCPRRPA